MLSIRNSLAGWCFSAKPRLGSVAQTGKKQEQTIQDVQTEERLVSAETDI